MYFYRMIETTWVHKLVSEEGPGSARDVHSKSYVTRIVNWKKPHGEDFAERIIKRHCFLGLKKDSPDGSATFDYVLKRRGMNADDEWEYVSSLYPCGDDCICREGYVLPTY